MVCSYFSESLFKYFSYFDQSDDFEKISKESEGFWWILNYIRIVAFREDRLSKYGPIEDFDSVTSDHSQNHNDVVNEMTKSTMIDQFYQKERAFILYS